MRQETTVARPPATARPPTDRPRTDTDPRTLTGPNGPGLRDAPDGTAGPGPRHEADHRNEIVVAGRITAEPLVRELPSGDRVATWRICVARPTDTRYAGRGFDSITCASFDHDLHEGIRAWRLGDVVRMSGELRRRTWRGREGVRSVCEVEARTATLLRAVGTGAVERKATGR
ncbi:single-stranded DNA-binding protein [Nocardiopsis sp. NPDC058631]|uniref:single-stranded DNA-binding protein n=1 Tax=Nocardiopsis sp. NPDC058631 TaxID=3346566 RepID=UPI00364B6772